MDSFEFTENHPVINSNAAIRICKQHCCAFADYLNEYPEERNIIITEHLIGWLGY